MDLSRFLLMIHRPETGRSHLTTRSSAKNHSKSAKPYIPDVSLESKVLKILKSVLGAFVCSEANESLLEPFHENCSLYVAVVTEYTGHTLQADISGVELFDQN